MKQIESTSYVESQQQTIKFDPAALRAQQNNPRVTTFRDAFRTLNLTGITSLSQSDAITLVDIQKQIRQKLRFFRVDPGF
jgi:hypothetical protein